MSPIELIEAVRDLAVEGGRRFAVIAGNMFPGGLLNVFSPGPNRLVPIRVAAVPGRADRRIQHVDGYELTL